MLCGNELPPDLYPDWSIPKSAEIDTKKEAKSLADNLLYDYYNPAWYGYSYHNVDNHT